MIQLMVRIAVEDLPMLAKRKQEEEIKKYLEKLQANAVFAQQTALNLLMEKQSTVSFETFSLRMASFRSGALTSPTGIRTFIRFCIEKRELKEENREE